MTRQSENRISIAEVTSDYSKFKSFKLKRLESQTTWKFQVENFKLKPHETQRNLTKSPKYKGTVAPVCRLVSLILVDSKLASDSNIAEIRIVWCFINHHSMIIESQVWKIFTLFQQFVGNKRPLENLLESLNFAEKNHFESLNLAAHRAAGLFKRAVSRLSLEFSNWKLSGVGAASEGKPWKELAKN